MDARDFSKFSFISMSGPRSLRLVGLIALLGVAVGLGANTFIGNKLVVDVWVFAIGFIVCNLVAGLILAGSVPDFKVKWAYFGVLVNELLFIVIASLFTFSARITFFDSLVLWTSAAYSIWMLMLSGMAAVKIGPKSILLSFAQPALVWSWLAVSLRIIPADPTAPLAIMGIAVAFSILVILFTEHVFSLIFSGMSGLAELSKFLKGLRGEQSSLDIGRNIDALVQYMMIKANGEKHVILIPWLHSGPLRSVGGGNLSTQCIEKMNNEYGESYVLHVPSNHEYNPSLSVADRVVKSISEVGYANLKASRVVTVEEGDMTVMGQKLNDTYLLSLSSKHVDDYDLSIFASLRETHKKERIIFVDSHHNPPMTECVNVETFSSDAELVNRLVERIMKKLSAETLYPAQIGMAIKFFDQYSIFALVVKAKETSLYFVADMNGFSRKEIGVIQDAAAKAGVDTTLLFTTDTHSLSVKALIERGDMPREIIESTVMAAVESLGPAQMAYGESTVKNVRIFGKTYYEMITVTQIMARVIPVLFLVFFLFIGVLLWIF